MSMYVCVCLYQYVVYPCAIVQALLYRDKRAQTIFTTADEHQPMSRCSNRNVAPFVHSQHRTHIHQSADIRIFKKNKNQLVPICNPTYLLACWHILPGLSRVLLLCAGVCVLGEGKIICLSVYRCMPCLYVNKKQKKHCERCVFLKVQETRGLISANFSYFFVVVLFYSAFMDLFFLAICCFYCCSWQRSKFFFCCTLLICVFVFYYMAFFLALPLCRGQGIIIKKKRGRRRKEIKAEQFNIVLPINLITKKQQ